MAVRSANSSYNSLEFMLRLHTIRDTVRDGRKKRLATESSQSPLVTYRTGQDARLKKAN